MRTRNLALLGIALVLVVLAAALLAPRPSDGSAYVPAKIEVAPAAAVTAPREATPVTYTLPEIVPTQVCGQPTTVAVPVPDSTDEVHFAGFVTTNGYIKITAELTDTGRTFTQPHEGWQVAPIAPYRAEHLTLVVTEPCPEPEEPPVVVDPPVIVDPPVVESPVVTDPQPADDGCNREGNHHGTDRRTHHD